LKVLELQYQKIVGTLLIPSTGWKGLWQCSAAEKVSLSEARSVITPANESISHGWCVTDSGILKHALNGLRKRDEHLHTLL